MTSRAACVGKLALVAVSLVTVVLGSEIALRFTPYRHELFLDAGDSTPRNYYKADPEAGYDIRENRASTTISLRIDDFLYDVWSNELGCFDRPYGNEPEYVLLVGDSFTHMFAPFGDKWGTVIEHFVGSRVLKCGVNGYGTKQELVKARKVIVATRTAPKLIVVGYYWNDLYEDWELPGKTVVDGYLVRVRSLADPATGELVSLQPGEVEQILGRRQLFCVSEEPAHPMLQRARCWFSRHSILYNLTRKSFKRLTGNQVKVESLEDAAFYPVDRYPWLRIAWKKHLQNLVAFRELAKQHNAKLLIVLLPSKAQVYPFLAAGKGLDPLQPNRILADFFDRERISYLDLLPLVRRYADSTTRRSLDSRKDLYWRNDFHLSIQGNRLVGLLVAKFILEHGQLEVSNPDGKLAAIDAKLRAFAQTASR